MKRWMFLCVGLALAFPSVSFAKKPLVVNVSIFGAVIGPSKWTGAPWDGTGKRNPKAFAATIKTVKSDGTPVPAVIKQVEKLAPKGAAAPDVFGYVTTYGPTTRALADSAATRFALATKRKAKRNTYTPRFDVTYDAWPVYAHTQFRIVLWDGDRSKNESIGVVNISQSDIADALDAGKPIWVNVYRRGQGQILYVKIRASKAAPNAVAKVEGEKYH